MFPGAPVHASAPVALRRPPPPTASCIERFRDRTLLYLGHKFWLYVAVVWALNIVGWGAFVALLYLALFLLPPGAFAGMDEDSLKYWINICIQVLTGLFSYQNGMTVPWRLAIGFHAAGIGHGPWKNGTDFYGRSTDAIWFHIERKPRVRITALLLAALVMHFSTQTCRIIWYSYYKSNATLGTIPTNTTFAGSIILAIVAGCIQGAQEKKLKAADEANGTRRYPPTVEDAVKDAVKRWRAGELQAKRPLQALKAAAASHQDSHTKWFVSKESDALQRTVRQSVSGSGSTRGRSETRSRRLTAAVGSVRDGLSAAMHFMSSSVSASSAAEADGDGDGLSEMMGAGSGMGGLGGVDSVSARSQRADSCTPVERGRSGTFSINLPLGLGRGRSGTMGRDRKESAGGRERTETTTREGATTQGLSQENSLQSSTI